MDELTKMVKSLSAEMERMRVEGRKAYKGPQITENKGGYKADADRRKGRSLNF
jgi:hypothetical protein